MMSESSDIEPPRTRQASWRDGLRPYILPGQSDQPALLVNHSEGEVDTRPNDLYVSDSMKKMEERLAELGKELAAVKQGESDTSPVHSVRPTLKVTCYRCSGEGHYARECGQRSTQGHAPHPNTYDPRDVAYLLNHSKNN